MPPRPPLPIQLAALLVLATAPLRADEIPAFAFPVDCDYGESCFIQNYVDHDPGPDRTDYACGRLSYDGHDGTDIRLPSEADIARDVAVLAAADGIVLRVRDGMNDININALPDDAVSGREAGNGVIIDHGNGWQTQYSHLRQGSVIVVPDQPVRQGQPIGAIGLSGRTEFPHVEFTVRFNDQPVDPFVGLRDREEGIVCPADLSPLWRAADAERLDYLATAALTAGFADGRPDSAVARTGGYDGFEIAPATPALVLWVDVMGVLAGDRQQFLILGPDGGTLHEHTSTLEASYVSWFAFSGRPAPQSGWPPGRYRARYTLIRDGAPVVELDRDVELN